MIETALVPSSNQVSEIELKTNTRLAVSIKKLKFKINNHDHTNYTIIEMNRFFSGHALL